jgi:hypothetical protein
VAVLIDTLYQLPRDPEDFATSVPPNADAEVPICIERTPRPEECPAKPVRKTSRSAGKLTADHARPDCSQSGARG